MNSLAAKCAEYAWFSDVAGDTYLGDAPTMISRAEQVMLHWLARELPVEPNRTIIDAGCFLGGSTLALATGLAHNKATHDKDHRIHSYDMFVAPNDRYSLDLIGHDRRPGDTVLDLYALSLGPLARHVMIHAGDYMLAPVPKKVCDLLFIDIGKTRELNGKVLTDMFPLLEPGRSIVVQQDFNDHSCPWVNASMEALSDYFDHLCDMLGSRVFMSRRPIPRSVLAEVATMSVKTELDLVLKSALAETVPVSQYFAACTASWSLFELDGPEAAITYLDTLPYKQPWEGESYIDLIKVAMGQLGAKAGLDAYLANFFKPAASVG